jgi:hypothetical protein
MIKKVEVETLQLVRLDGEYVSPGEVVLIDEQLSKDWIKLGLAKPVEENMTPVKGGEKNGPKGNNSTGDGAANSGGGKKPPKNRRKR